MEACTPQKRLNVLRRVRPPSVIEQIPDKTILANQAMISMASRCPPGQHARTKLRLLARCETSRFAPPLDQAMHHARLTRRSQRCPQRHHSYPTPGQPASADPSNTALSPPPSARRSTTATVLRTSQSRFRSLEQAIGNEHEFFLVYATGHMGCKF